MSQSCPIKKCERSARTLCPCCNQKLCRDHFDEHSDSLNSQLDPLNDEIDALNDRLTAFKLGKATNKSRQQLNQWRLESHEAIDRFYSEKCKEVDQYVTEKPGKQSTAGTVAQEMNNIEQVRDQVSIAPLAIDNNLIQIEKSNTPQFDLSTLAPPYGTVKRPMASSNALACNDRFTLVYIYPNLCFINEELSIVKQNPWDHTDISDMCCHQH